MGMRIDEIISGVNSLTAASELQPIGDEFASAWGGGMGDEEGVKILVATTGGGSLQQRSKNWSKIGIVLLAHLNEKSVRLSQRVY